MSSTTIVCSPTLAPAGESQAAVETWIRRTFPDVQVSTGDGTPTAALIWRIERTRDGAWLDASMDANREAFYFKGDVDLICEAALALVDLFPTDADMVLVDDAVGTVFDLRVVRDAGQLAEAWDSDDEALIWIDPNESAGD